MSLPGCLSQAVGDRQPDIAPPLSGADLQRAMEKVRADTGYTRSCGPPAAFGIGGGGHILHPYHVRDGGWGTCGSCFASVYVEPPADEHITRGEN